MTYGAGLVLLLALVGVGLAWHDAPPRPAPGQRLAWTDLTPPGWHPVTGGADIASLRDDSPAARARWAALQTAWESAPLRHDLDGVEAQLSGYLVPLEGGRQGLTEFLLVPYYGACIHSPPPPANQVVWVRLSEPLPTPASFAQVEVTGRLSVQRQRSTLAASGYRMDGTAVAKGREGL
ncbi:MAG: DUF3299 domain-containing protein [Roseateles sp.]